MKDLLDKISSYNIFNYLLPGVLFAAFVDGLINLQVLQKDLIVGAFLYYFLGSVVSRVGSLVVEPILRRTKFLSFAPYGAFVKAAKADPKIELLSEVNNMYRTFVALFLSVAIVALYSKASNYFPFLHAAAPWVCIVGLFGLFLMSYRKQTDYVVKRVEANKP